MSNMNEQAALDRMAAARMHVAALHNALKIARAQLDNGGNLPEPLARAIDEALTYGEPDGIAILATARSIAAVAREPERLAELPELAERLERLVAAHDGG
jgi:hypothetical protein